MKISCPSSVGGSATNCFVNPRGVFASSARTARVALQSHSGVCALSLPEPARDRIQLCVYCPPLCAFLFAWHHDVRKLERWRLTRQREHLVHSDPGSHPCITQAGLANLFLHPTGAQLSDVREDAHDALFSCAYLRGFATPPDETASARLTRPRAAALWENLGSYITEGRSTRSRQVLAIGQESLPRLGYHKAKAYLLLQSGQAHGAPPPPRPGVVLPAQGRRLPTPIDRRFLRPRGRERNCRSPELLGPMWLRLCGSRFLLLSELIDHWASIYLPITLRPHRPARHGTKPPYMGA